MTTLASLENKPKKMEPESKPVRYGITPNTNTKLMLYGMMRCINMRNGVGVGVKQVKC